MASVFANYAFDQTRFDLNQLERNWLETYFNDDGFFTVDNRIYPDLYEVVWDREGMYRHSLLFGDWLTIDSEFALTGGSVTGYYELWPEGDSWIWDWGVRDFSVPATSFYSAMQTETKTDDAALLASILAGNDRFDLSNYADKAYAYGGNDRMLGLGGNDTLDGGAGTDTLFGGAGNDRILGGTGKDIMSGSSGSDVFIFRTTTETSASTTYADVISDFSTVYDRISLSAIDAFTPTTTNNTFVWKATGSFTSTTAGEVRYHKFDLAGTSSDYTMIYIDTDGDVTAEAAIRLSGLRTLTADDFIL